MLTPSISANDPSIIHALIDFFQKECDIYIKDYKEHPTLRERLLNFVADPNKSLRIRERDEQPTVPAPQHKSPEELALALLRRNECKLYSAYLMAESKIALFFRKQYQRESQEVLDAADMTTPETTPIPKATAKILTQN